ncbi:zf-HC2 domain-containing protein [Actinocorallia sp. A-T 12471]|uniref:anti-sigma factor family protein n=1 Tax=Actinocorallia sp. A-T 12471 TaxID=3089813 RepID=UPI0029CF97FC|nr:zf-HC2 domain-containing protein [Actinocorallia sp. A-T 12471]MDX6738788.1 zf-HC2 domain-containing protein [Actinocorallia sp. A-T 12471]
MSCLGERLTALVDGELDHDERDRAQAHLVLCAACRGEVEALRAVKRRLGALGGAAPSTDLMIGLYNLGRAPAAPVPAPDFFQALMMTNQAEMPDRYRRPRDTRPARSPGVFAGQSSFTAPRRRIPRARSFVVGAATLAALGAGTASSVAPTAARVPNVTPSFTQQVSGGNGLTQVRLPRRLDEAKR